MTPICRVCGSSHIVPMTPRMREMFPFMTDLPLVLRGWCINCVWHALLRVEDEEFDAGRFDADKHATTVVADMVSDIATRVATGRPLVRCEGVGHSWDDFDVQCERWASRERDGRPVCGYCDRGHVNGRGRWFSEGQSRAKPILIWARNAEELLSRACEAAQNFREAAT